MNGLQHLQLKALVVAIGLTSAAVEAAPFTAGDLVVYRVGDGSAALTSAAASVFLDEYTTSGSFVQSVALPTAGNGSNHMLTASGSATSEGLLTLSANGQYLALTGYNAAVGTATVASTSSATVNRTVGIVNVATGNIDTSTALTDASSGNNFRSAVTTNGTDIWVAGGAGGVRYTTDGATTSTQLSTTVTNIRQVNVFDGQLYASDSSGTAVRLGTVGTGVPTTTGQTITNLPGLSASTGSPYSFFFAHLGTGTTGPDTLYVADDTTGITRYNFDGVNWTAAGKVGAAADTYRGLSGVVKGTEVDLFATGGSKLVSIIDTSGYKGTLTANANLLATVATNEAFRGVVAIPTSVPVPATVWLFASGLLGMLGYKRRKV